VTTDQHSKPSSPSPPHAVRSKHTASHYCALMHRWQQKTETEHRWRHRPRLSWGMSKLLHWLQTLAQKVTKEKPKQCNPISSKKHKTEKHCLIAFISFNVTSSTGTLRPTTCCDYQFIWRWHKAPRDELISNIVKYNDWLSHSDVLCMSYMSIPSSLPETT